MPLCPALRLVFLVNHLENLRIFFEEQEDPAEFWVNEAQSTSRVPSDCIGDRRGFFIVVEPMEMEDAKRREGADDTPEKSEVRLYLRIYQSEYDQRAKK